MQPLAELCRQKGIAAADDAQRVARFDAADTLATARALGGTSVLIVVGVAIDTMRQIETLSGETLPTSCSASLTIARASTSACA